MDSALELLDLIAPWRWDDEKSWFLQLCPACKNSGILYEEFERRSLTQKHQDKGQIRRAWINTKSRAGIGTLAHMAREDGAAPEKVKEILRNAPKVARPPQEVIAQKTKSLEISAIEREVERRKSYLAKCVETIKNEGYPLTQDALTCELWENSRIHMDWTPGPEDAIAVLSHLYAPDENLYIGEQFRGEVFPVGAWIDKIKSKGAAWPYIVPNPLTGEVGKTKDGKPSKRADSCVKAFRFIVCEMDEVSLEQQMSFWLYAITRKVLPVACLVHSAGSSIHAWVRVDAKNAEEWESEVERKLFPQFLEPVGVDPKCKNESRLSRLAGHSRADKEGRTQKLLYLNPFVKGGDAHA